MENKLKIAKDYLVYKLEDIKTEKEFVSEAPEKYTGKTLIDEIRRWSENVAQSEVIIEAMKMYIDDLEMKEQQAEEHDREMMIDCPECEKEHDSDMSCLEAGAVRLNV